MDRVVIRSMFVGRVNWHAIAELERKHGVEVRLKIFERSWWRALLGVPRHFEVWVGSRCLGEGSSAREAVDNALEQDALEHPAIVTPLRPVAQSPALLRNRA